MKIVKKSVYYCEFCKKRSLSGWHMKNHENHCTANPNRNCRLCEKNISTGKAFNIGQIVTELKKRFKIIEVNIEDDEGNFLYKDLKAEWTGEPVTLDEVRKIVDGCPNCMLAIIRQCQFAYHYFEDMGFEKFDYKGESREAIQSMQDEDWY